MKTLLNTRRPYEEKILETVGVCVRVIPSSLQIVRAQKLAKNPFIKSAIYRLDERVYVEIKDGRSKFWEVKISVPEVQS